MTQPRKKETSPHTRMLADLAESGLDGKDAKALQLQPMTAAQCASSLKLSRAGDGYLIPYYRPDGTRLEMFRYRFFDTEGRGYNKGEKLRKYDQPFGTNPEIFLPKNLLGNDWAKIKADPKVGIFIVEGEKKAACVTKHVGPCIGLGGVFNYGGIDLLPSLRSWNWDGREVTICFDADKAEKYLVRLAECRLASVLTGLGAKVFIKTLPPDGPKGADDFIVEYGKDKFEALPVAQFEKSRHLSELSATYGLVRQNAMILEFPTEQRPGFLLHTPENFKVIEAHRKITRTVGDGKKERTVTESAAKEWLESPGKPTFTALTYLPGGLQVTRKKEFNTWRPSGIEPLAGDTSLFDQLTEHLIENDDDRKWSLQWSAYTLQHPGTKLATAMLLWGERQGTGKSMWGETIGRLHGEHNYNVIEQAHLDANFNGWLAGRTFIHGSEVCGERDSRSLADKLKSYITAEEIQINEKHQRAYPLPNYASFYLTSNHRNALFLDDNARRFMVIHAKRPPLPDKFYRDYSRWLAGGGNRAILHKLLTFSLEGFNPKAAAPRTDARAEMIAAGRSDLQAWCHALKEDPTSVLIVHGTPVPWASSAYATVAELLDVYLQSNPHSRVNQQQLGNELGNAGLTRAYNDGQVRMSSKAKVRLWIINPLRAENTGTSHDRIAAEFERTRQPFKHLQRRQKGGK